MPSFGGTVAVVMQTVPPSAAVLVTTMTVDYGGGVQDDVVQPNQLVFHVVAVRRPTSAGRAPAPGPVHHVTPLLVVRQHRRLQLHVLAAVVRSDRQRSPPTPSATVAAAAAKFIVDRDDTARCTIIKKDLIIVKKISGAE
jgi:hypothetical protein